MNESLKKMWKWIAVSSADPKKLSLALRMSLIAAIPWVLKLTGIACGFGLFCIDVDSGNLEQVVESLSNVVFGTALVVSSIGAIYGWVRKVMLTVQGKNKALEQ